MYSKLTYYLIVILFSTSFVFAQKNESEKIYRFKNNLSYYDNNAVDMSLVTPHYLGNNIAIKLYLLKDAYTRVQPATPTSPSEKTIIEKPIIYYAITRLSRKYKREIKKGNISEDQARENLNEVLDVGLSIFHDDTDEFENELKTAKKPEEIVQVFSKVVLE
jgi:hypothetical protein